MKSEINREMTNPKLSAKLKIDRLLIEDDLAEAVAVLVDLTPFVSKKHQHEISLVSKSYDEFRKTKFETGLIAEEEERLKREIVNNLKKTANSLPESRSKSFQSRIALYSKRLAWVSGLIFVLGAAAEFSGINLKDLLFTNPSSKDDSDSSNLLRGDHRLGDYYPGDSTITNDKTNKIDSLRITTLGNNSPVIIGDNANVLYSSGDTGHVK